MTITVVFILLIIITFSLYYIFSITQNNVKEQKVTFSTISSDYIPIVSEDEYSIKITTGNSFVTKIGDTLTLPIVFQLSEKYRKDLTPYILYVAYLEDNTWQQIYSEYLSGDITEKSLQIETRTLDLPPDNYTFVIALFSSTNFSKGSSLAEVLFNLTLLENEDNPEEPYTIGGKVYDRNSTELYLTDITNQGFKKLSNFKELTSLQVTSEVLTDISPIVEMENLKQLFLFSTTLKDIEPLKNMTNLTHLGLGGVNINGPGSRGDLYDITPISGLTNLESLTIKDCQVSDISALKNLSRLKTLWIYKTKISDLSPVSELIHLTDLRVHYNQITDISCLKNLQELKFLAVSYNYFPPEQVSELKKIIPDCNIMNN